MTIKQLFPFNQKLLVTLKVLKVHYEIASGSTWWVQYKDYEPFQLEEHGRTTEADEQLNGQEIEGQIYLNDSEILPTQKEEKHVIFYKGSNGMVITGMYEDIIENRFEEKDSKMWLSYKLDSIFPAEIDDLPRSFKKGEWLTISAEGMLMLPRKLNVT